MNYDTLDFVSKSLRNKFDFTTTTVYHHEVNPTLFLDHRNLVNGKKDPSSFEAYTQVFDDKHGFINNLSVLDLLFNEGKFTIDYLKEQTL